MRRLVLSGFGSGYLSPAPGTWGSLVALIPALLLHILGGPIALALAAVLLGWLGIGMIADETAGGDEDPGWIVADEWVGQWIALLPVSLGAWIAGQPLWALWPGLVSAFIAFRLFDIWKPWLVGRADRRGDAVGVMLDDVWAGVFAAVVTLLLAALAHGAFIGAVPDQI